MRFLSLLYRRLFNPIYNCIEEHHAEIAAENAARLHESSEMIAALSARLDAAMQENEALNRYVAFLESNYDTIAKDHYDLKETVKSISALDLGSRVSNTETECRRLDIALTKLKKQLTVRPAEQVTSAEIRRDTGGSAGAAQYDSYTGVDYFNFENHFRGSRELIKERQKEYLKYFESCSSILDIGCGRGEFLELMRDSGLSAVGVDTYEDFVEYCRSLGLDAVCADGIGYLKSIESIDGIFVGQVVEHLTTEQVIALIDTAYEKLTEGGVLIMETPNPRSLSIFTNAFYIDPSHNKPVHPETLKYFARNAGFENIETVYTAESRLNVAIPPLDGQPEFNNAMSVVQDMLFGSQDYAVIARK